MAETMVDLRAVKAAAKAQFWSVSGVCGIGIGDGTLRIYITHSEVKKQLPETFQGVPVEFVVTGDISAG